MTRDEQLIGFCRELIRTPSISGEEENVAKLIEKTMKEYGYDRVIIDKYGSVIGCIHGKRPGKTILMDGHIDTVPISDPDKWTHDPYAAEIIGGRMYGRGTSDMKCSVGSMVSAAAYFAQDTHKDFAGDIYVSGSVHEELFEGVSCREVARIVKPDYVIIGEATSTTVKIGQRGRAEVVVETAGKSCHSSNPEKGINAVYHMMAVVEEIRKIKPHEHELLGKGILELTDIISAPYPGSSVVPGLCRATFDRRLLVGETEETVLGQVQEAIGRAKQRIPELNARVYLERGEKKCWTGETIADKRFFPAWVIDKEDDFVKNVRAGLLEAGLDAPLSHFSFCTNGSSFCGENGIKTVGYGPSLESLAHVVDEYIELEQLTKSCKGFYSILEKLTAR